MATVKTIPFRKLLCAVDSVSFIQSISFLRWGFSPLGPVRKLGLREILSGPYSYSLIDLGEESRSV